ncbi:hypothetical protein DPMN_164497 [Dreissena polymorpha]|uniref:Uncharacterized protein n=1 Tax=Dreissena polymorpha TaxID=45954 RepID=A0A9D4EYM7_DREPO|nr:hypothetical protein DPMN_164497 [Dreissena polymorpha]
MWIVIDGLQTDNMSVETILERARNCNRFKSRKNKKSALLQKKLNSLCTSYNNGERTVSEFLDSIGSCIRLHKVQ